MHGYQFMDWGLSVNELQNARGNPLFTNPSVKYVTSFSSNSAAPLGRIRLLCYLFAARVSKTVELRWSRPVIWGKDDCCPTIATDKPIVYAIVRNHGKFKEKDHIEYIGLTTKPEQRFVNHLTAEKIVKTHGEVKFSYAPVDFVRGKNRIEKTKAALEEIEHLLIWAVGDYLYNEKKQYTLPGMGKNGGNAWQIINTGYRFSGRMPREIVYPWLLIKPGRNRAGRASVVSVSAATE